MGADPLTQGRRVTSWTWFIVYAAREGSHCDGTGSTGVVITTISRMPSVAT